MTVASKKISGAALVGHRAGSQGAPSACHDADGGAPVLDGKGRIILPGAKAPQPVRVPVALCPRVVGGFLVVPAVLDEIEFQTRLAKVKAANVMVAHGISANKAAVALGLAKSRLSVMRAAYLEQGEDGLRPKPHNAGRRPANGRQRRAPAFLELMTSRPRRR